MSNSESDAGLTNWNHNISECCPKPNDASSQVCTEPQNVCIQNIFNFTIYTEWDSHICARLWYWQNLVKSMGRSLQVQILNYLSILSLESSMDAQNGWFMHTINQSICFVKILCGCFLIFFKTWKSKWKMVPNLGHFSVMFIITKINSFKVPNNNRHLKWYLEDQFSVPKHCMGRERCFCCCYTRTNKWWCSLRIVFTDTGR